MLLVFQNKTNIEIVGFYLIRFRFALDSSNIDMWMLDTHLDLLDTNIPGKHFVFLQDVLKTSSRHVFKTSSKHVLKTFSRRLQEMSWRPTNVCWVKVCSRKELRLCPLKSKKELPLLTLVFISFVLFSIHLLL